MTIAITAFDPFAGEKINPALEAMRLLPDELSGARIIKLELPTVFGRAPDLAIQALEKYKPDALISVGQAGGRAAITPERIAINIDDASIADNEGNKPVDRPICPDGPAAYFSTLPVKAIVEAIQGEGIPACLSNSAGTFVCNHLMYSVLHHVHKNKLPVRAGFIHVPFIPDQAAGKPSPPPSMALADIVRALEAAIRAIIKAR